MVVCRRFDRLLRDVTICLVGKYTRLQDSYASVIKALSHAAMACNYKLDLKVSVCHMCLVSSVLIIPSSIAFESMQKFTILKFMCVLVNVYFWLYCSSFYCYGKNKTVIELLFSSFST